jgi:hypothetical protein
MERSRSIGLPLKAGGFMDPATWLRRSWLIALAGGVKPERIKDEKR